MKAREKIELTLIPIAVGAVGIEGNHLPASMGVGTLMVIGCLGWLVQGGIRDLWLLYLTKTRVDSMPRRKVACMCVESTVGMTGLLIGIVLALAGVGRAVTMSPSRWAAFAAGVLVLGFVAKDYVVSWHPLSVRREPDHHTFIFTWR